jgi:hypothetical protein
MTNDIVPKCMGLNHKPCITHAFECDINGPETTAALLALPDAVKALRRIKTAIHDNQKE